MINNLLSYYCGLEIKRLRKERGLSGKELANLLYISQQQISRYERGTVNFTIDFLFEICAALKISFLDFINGIISIIQEEHGSNPKILKKLLLTTEQEHFF
ncbi:TPA: helix-turn-helix domain-containing protein [Providencia alcalifaciens]|uniref:helix-turn-helix domain-containing protein n=1 Tax=Providencia alcalifaciens TaxID=126385 RepID=UPI00029C26E2|nr:helix-turn-helix transcriptional regulator [Providencia alcalifaciens]EKT61917.1 fimbrial operon regulator [Providencia alcalifaciens Dmel2]